MYIKIKKLPSGYKPYPPGTEIGIRELTFGEIMAYSEFSDRVVDILNYFEEREVITGIDFFDITAGDWHFLQLQLVSLSYATPSYTFRGPVCNRCSRERSKESESKKLKPSSPEDVTVPIIMEGFNAENIPPEFRASLVPAEFIFSEVPEEVITPLSISLSKGRTVEMDFYRLRDFKKLLEQGLPNKRSSEISIMTGLSLEDDLSEMDFAVLNEAYEMLDHGLAKTVILTCPKCKRTREMEVDWDLVSLIPFYRDRQSLKDRISFGTVSKPADSPAKKTSVSSGSSTLRPMDR